MMNNLVGRCLAVAKSKSDLHAAIDALPDNAQLILVANACRGGNPDHAAGTGNLVFHAAYGEPTLLESVGLLRLTEHALISAAD
jgi:hypothetical protein